MCILKGELAGGRASERASEHAVAGGLVTSFSILNIHSVVLVHPPRPGIFPRQPKSTKKANKGSTAPASFYYVKDIQYLLHEPVLQKLRQYKTFSKKLSKAVGRGEWSVAKSLEENQKPKYRLDHIIKERCERLLRHTICGHDRGALR